MTMEQTPEFTALARLVGGPWTLLILTSLCSFALSVLTMHVRDVWREHIQGKKELRTLLLKIKGACLRTEAEHILFRGFHPETTKVLPELMSLAYESAQRTPPKVEALIKSLIGHYEEWVRYWTHPQHMAQANILVDTRNLVHACDSALTEL